MSMIRRAHNHCIDAFFLVQHLTKILIPFSVRIFIESVSGMILIHIAQSHNVLAADLLQVRGALATDANARDIEFVIGRGFTCSTEHPRFQHHEGGNGRRVAEEGSSGDGLAAALQTEASLAQHYTCELMRACEAGATLMPKSKRAKGGIYCRMNNIQPVGAH